MLRFLEAVDQNNNTTRMHANRDLYLQEKNRYNALIDRLLQEMKKRDKSLKDIELKDCLYRFNKDIRFSKDKRPYKTRFGAFLAEGGRKSPLPWYYLHIEPWNSWVSGGSWCPSPAQRDAIILHIWQNWDKREKIMKNNKFEKYYGKLEYGEEKDISRIVKTHRVKALFQALGEKKTLEIVKKPEAMKLLSQQNFCVWHSLSEEEVVAENLENEVMKGFELLIDFNNFIWEAF